jgi:hypothetical protein
MTSKLKRLKRSKMQKQLNEEHLKLLMVIGPDT